MMNLKNMLSEINQNTKRQILCELPRIGIVLETESRIEVTRGWEWGKGCCFFHCSLIKSQSLRVRVSLPKSDSNPAKFLCIIPL